MKKEKVRRNSRMRAIAALGAMVALAVALAVSMRSFSRSLIKAQVDNYASVVRSIALNMENLTSQSEQALLLFASSADFNDALKQYTDEGLSWPLNRISLQFCVYYSQVIENMLISPTEDLDDSIWYLRRKAYVPLALVSSNKYAVMKVYRTARKNETSLGITVTNADGYHVTAMISLDLLYAKVLGMVKLADVDDLLTKTSDGLIVMSRNSSLIGLSAEEAYEELGRQYGVDVSPMLAIVDRERTTTKQAGRDTYTGFWFNDTDDRPTRKQVVFAKSVADSGYFIISLVVDYQEFLTYLGSSMAGITILSIAIFLIAFWLWFHQIQEARKRAMMEKENTYLRELNRTLTYVNEMARQKNQQQRLEIIGTLTYGIAHELNNLLTPIMGYSGMLLEQKTPEDPEYEDVKEIFSASEKARDVIQQISSFGRKNSEPFKQVLLDKLLTQIVKLARGLMPPNIHFSSEMPKRHATVFCNTTQISQVVLNMILNAIDAIGAGEEGHIRISVDFVPASQLSVPPDTLAEEFVAIRISDDGCGMDDQTRDNIFKPFFTTKRGGNGLGLMISDHIVKAHHGQIVVDSAPGKGSTFSVLLPRSEEQEEKEKEEPRELGFTEVPSADVLVADADSSTVNLYRKGLSKRQFAVTIVQSGADALSRLRSHRYEVFIVDESVRDVCWTELTMKARQLWPTQTIVLVSSGMEKRVLDSLSSGILDGYIFKPFTVEELAVEVADVLKY